MTDLFFHDGEYLIDILSFIGDFRDLMLTAELIPAFEPFIECSLLYAMDGRFPEYLGIISLIVIV